MKRVRVTVIISVIVVVLISIGYGGSINKLPTFSKSLGGSDFDYAYSIQQASDGGYIVAGFTSSTDGDVTGNHGNYDYWVVKLDRSGNIQWQKCLGGSANDFAYNIQKTRDGGYIVAGITSSIDGNVTGNHGSYDYWIVKLNGRGKIQWQKCLGGSGYDYAYNIQKTSDGGYIVAGFTSSTDGDVTGNHGGADYWIVKLDGSGNIQWQKCLGGSADDYAYSIKKTSDGGYIVAGYTHSDNGDVTGNNGGYDYWVVKLDESGDMQWQKCLGGSNDDYAYSIQEANSGGYVVAGFAKSTDGDVTGNHGNGDYWIVKLDGSGDIQWQKCLGGSSYNRAYSIQKTNDGGYIVAGYTLSTDRDVTGNHGNGDYWIVKLDGRGNIQWQKYLGGSDDDFAESIRQTSDGGYIIAGSVASNNGDVTENHGGYDYWVVKLK